ncbi:phosphatidate cytidylyltransferase [Turicibacter sanguinis]|jgi:cytidylyltransferase family|uniref:Phosphatidate cytidylyltransferase n=2 Tax=Turicibacter sanguinis TaxID=154288 RepID=A0ABN0A4B8_9FIRM|nr:MULTISPECIES: phosphatidate cytidylyltransferase [Turicibacter]EFF64614.1 phosphatidate cytidylyltransferase [Turicibacter sanguinis PC909]MBP3903244.1 phosphatidate cytidylyltransferase [Turicibacter sp.]MCU7191261.1 phosphatidate cytidylyltransferase [Turicibacter sanguinis]MCU7210531.1 phosphatidate cytidylyltransferase [Turicibacter sanguinis]MDB8438316.1 phosphatidate cytidylyltransferase [Turicibacter sanguinis]
MKQRVLTAIVIIAIGLPILIYGRLPFIILGVLLALVASQEMIDMRETISKTPVEIKVFTMIAILMIVFSSFDFRTLSFTGTLVFGLGTMALFLFILLLAVVTRKQFTVNDAGYYLLTIFYIGSTFHSMIFLRSLGLNLFLFMIIVVAVTDSGAYFVGRKLGKRKLAPLISPNKTVEGSVGGTILGVLVGSIFGVITGVSDHVIVLAMMSLVVAAVAQFGDLVASSMKREYGIKDFGTLFPGHGGVLDRFDSHLYASLALYILINVMNVVI